jgi:hypothetical protein
MSEQDDRVNPTAAAEVTQQSTLAWEVKLLTYLSSRPFPLGSACRKRILLEGVTSSQIKYEYQLYSLPDEVVGDVLIVLVEAMEIPDPYEHLKTGMLETLIYSKFEKLELLSEQSRFMDASSLLKGIFFHFMLLQRLPVTPRTMLVC